DVVDVGSVVGAVARIGMRSSTVRTAEGAEVIVPNGDLISKSFTNWTLSDRRRRVEIRVGVAYGTDPEKVIALLLEAAGDHPEALADPPPAAAGFFHRLGRRLAGFRAPGLGGAFRTGHAAPERGAARRQPAVRRCRHRDPVPAARREPEVARAGGRARGGSRPRPRPSRKR